MAGKTKMGDISRIPPQNLEAEQCTLGALMLSGDVVQEVADFLKPEHFYSLRHRIVYENILVMADSNEPVDLVTLTERLRQKKKLDDAGGVSYVTKIARQVPSAANVNHYARIVYEKGVLRNLLKAITAIDGMVYQGTDDFLVLLDKAEQLVFSVVQKRGGGDITGMKGLMDDTFNLIEELYRDKGRIKGVRTGFVDLDLKTSGFQNSDLIILAARTSVGKTSFALNIAVNVALGTKNSQSHPVAIFSIEMDKTQLAMRMLCSMAKIDANRLRSGYLRQQDWVPLTSAAGQLAEAPIFIDDSPSLDLMELRARARRLKVEHDIGLIIIDYLQLIRTNQKWESRQAEVAHMSRSLKALARELDVPVIALCQLSREADKRGGRPRLSDLRESGAIEQDADLVVFLYRDTSLDNNADTNQAAEVIIGKHRNGPTGVVELLLDKKYMRFGNLSRYEVAPF